GGDGGLGGVGGGGSVRPGCGRCCDGSGTAANSSSTTTSGTSTGGAASGGGAGGAGVLGRVGGTSTTMAGSTGGGAAEGRAGGSARHATRKAARMRPSESARPSCAGTSWERRRMAIRAGTAPRPSRPPEVARGRPPPLPPRPRAQPEGEADGVGEGVVEAEQAVDGHEVLVHLGEDGEREAGGEDAAGRAGVSPQPQHPEPEERPRVEELIRGEDAEVGQLVAGEAEADDEGEGPEQREGERGGTEALRHRSGRGGRAGARR